MASSLFAHRNNPRRFYLVAASIAFAYAPILYFHTKSIWQRTYYQFAPILAVACVFLFWQHLKQTDHDSRMPRLEMVFLSVAFVLLIASVTLFSPWIGALSAIFATGSLLLYLGGRARFGELLPAWCLLWLMLPPPFGFDIQLVSKLQAFTSVQASRLLDFIGINHLMSGNVLEFSDRTLLVEEACSGIQSLFALFAYTALYVVWRRIPPVRALPLMITSVFWAGALNVVRVFAIALAASRLQLDLSVGWRHEVLGIVVFVVALLLIASTDQWLKFCLRISHGTVDLLFENSRIMRIVENWQLRRAEQTATTGSETCPQPASGVWRSLVVCGAFLFVGLTQLGMLGYAAVSPPATALSFEKAAEFMLPDTMDGWQLADFQTEHRSTSSIFGEHSRIWTYEAPVGEVVVSFDYPFGSWHDLRTCYRGTGWTIVSTIKHDGVPVGLTDPIEFLEVEMKQQDGRIGYLLFGEFENSGRPVQPMVVSDDRVLPLMSYLTSGLRDRWSKRMVEFGLPIRTYQLQVLSVSDAGLSEYERSQMIDQFRLALGLACAAMSPEADE